MFKVWIFLVSTVVSFNANAFIENVTHGYPNCMACHVSPSGGGVLTDYGRSLSREMMSTWGWNKSEEVLFGAVKTSDNFKIGGDIRWIQSHFENANIKQGRNFLMQQNIELAYNLGKTWLVSTFGTNEGPKGTPDKGEFFSERHYVLSELAEGVFVRAGKFRTTFGLNDPNHTRATEGAIGFGSKSETYNLEVSKFTETGEFFLSTSLGRIDEPRETQSEKSVSALYARYFKDKNKIGASALIGESQSQRRTLVGGFGVMALPLNSTLVAELDFQRSHMASNPTDKIDGIFSQTRWVFEPFKGVRPYGVVEYRQTDLTDKTTMQANPGAGLQWLPIPHIEFQLEYQKIYSRRSPNDNADFAYLISHYYF